MMKYYFLNHFYNPCTNYPNVQFFTYLNLLLRLKEKLGVTLSKYGFKGIPVFHLITLR